MIGLTERQCDALRFIARFQAAKGFSPSRREIAAALDLRSMSAAQKLIMGLADRSAIRILPDRHRTIEILTPVADATAPGTIGLNPRQQDALRFITGYIERNGIPPSIREIARGIGTSPESTNYVHRMLKALEQNGAISLSEAEDRGITVLRPLPIPRAPDGEPLHFVRIGESAA
jgi:SOS-response transcriptional repressor LexA